MENNYYWKDYDGVTIPENAVELLDDSKTYVGQAYVHQWGIFVGTIYEGERYMEVSAYGHKISEVPLIKILCADVNAKPPPNFSWKATTREKFAEDMIGQYPVVGGYDYVNQGSLNIGRVVFNSSLVAGSITGFSKHDVSLYVAAGNHDAKFEAFEVLVNPLEYSV